MLRRSISYLVRTLRSSLMSSLTLRSRVSSSSASAEMTESMASRVSRSGTSDVKLTLTFWRNLDTRFSTSSTRIISPSLMMPILSQTAWTSARSWLLRNMVFPSALSSLRSLWAFAAIRGSSPEVGSSNIRKSGFEANASMSPTCCRFPELRALTFRVRSTRNTDLSSSMSSGSTGLKPP
ncbi:hypothetical protein ES707_08302 [subsurface metagenome]